MGLVWLFLAVLVAFLAIDALMLTFVMIPLFQRHVSDLFREQMQMGVALGFYVFYVAGLLYFAVLPGLAQQRPGLAILNGAILGFLAYGTYEATNMATLRGWSWEMMATDVIWGTVLTAGVAGLGYAIGRHLL